MVWAIFFSFIFFACGSSSSGPALYSAEIIANVRWRDNNDMKKLKKRFRYLLISCWIVILFFFLGCASQNINLGASAYNNGDYNLAAKYWNPLAKQGNYVAQYNLGLLWEQGLGSTPLNKNEASQWFLLSAQQGYVPAMVRLARIQKENGYEEAALSWFNLAARWGNTDATTALRSWGKYVPQADLLAAQQYRDAISRQTAINALGDAAYQLGRAIGGGGSEKTSSSYTPSSTFTPSSFGRNSQSTYKETGCTSDYSCGIGLKCVKAPLESSGVCMKIVDEYGVKQYNLPDTNSVGPNLDLDGQCTFDTDCPIGFKCDRNYKACIKR